MIAALEAWLTERYAHSARCLSDVLSPVALTQARPGFDQRVRGARGAVVASPRLGHYDPQPDYFFHWFRDSALVMDALRVLYEAGTTDQNAALRQVADFVDFTTRLLALDGTQFVVDAQWRNAVAPDFVKFLRPATELAQVHGAAVLAEARVNADGSLDVSRWNRPQHDGAPLLALILLRWRDVPELPRDTRAALDALLSTALAATCRHAGDASFDIWEEEYGRHYYLQRVAGAALAAGAAWRAKLGDTTLALRYRNTAEALLHGLEDFRDPQSHCYRSRFVAGGNPDKQLDMAVILSVIHAGGDGGGAHTAYDPRVHATLARLETYFAQVFPINHGRPATDGAALGRYLHDAYYSGGPWPVCTLAAAELCFRAAIGAKDPAYWITRGDSFLHALQRLASTNATLPEQYDPRSGAADSALQLGWSDAAFITACHARRAALGRH
ncbi:MAG: glucan 1,4-alpha-glucosidase [Nevskiaceae bacterium]|nr:MAG: glucan 1,4-alpha-glucosidase [Nevskiaceae bacterium]TBR74591.1 MAG: glucan 1,4-alpha-glucosidase [Nevskiaceae bacterium]